MPDLILSGRARISAQQADKVLRCYAQRHAPKQAARHSGLSLNAVYELYARIRWRLILAGYYRDGAHTMDEPGLAPAVMKELKRRRGLGPDDIYAHAAEAIEWAEEWPPGEVLRHLRKIIALTGPLDVEPDISAEKVKVLHTYIRYARTKLIHDRVKTQAEDDETHEPFLARIQPALEQAWRDYRTATKQAERATPPTRPRRPGS